MAKKIKCRIILNTRWGYCSTPIEFNSIAAAKRYAKESFGFAYRIFTEDGRIINGFCE